MGDFEEKLDSILNNPQAMSQIMSLAQSLSGASASEAAPPPVEEPPASPTIDSGLQLDPQLLGKIMSLFGSYNGQDDQRVALLTALRPFVKERRYAKLDQAIQIAKLSRMARMALELFRSGEDQDV